jgi:hypothetical protein
VSIDSTDVLSAIEWEKLDYSDATTFVSRRECLPLAILFFLCEELGDKLPALKGQVHAGWLQAFKEPITMDKLLDPPAEIDFEYTDDEEDWLLCTMQHFVHGMSQETREGLSTCKNSPSNLR